MADGVIRDEYLEQFIIEGGTVKFSTADGRRWQMRQPSPDEAAAGDSAYRLMRQRVLDDKRLGELAANPAALKQEAHIRASAAESVYMIPLLLLDDSGNVAFDVFDDQAMAEFEQLSAEVIGRMTHVYWSIMATIGEAKKKLAADSSSPSLPVVTMDVGPSPSRRSGGPMPKA